MQKCVSRKSLSSIRVPSYQTQNNFDDATISKEDDTPIREEIGSLTYLTDDDDTIREEDDAPISEEIPKRWVGRGASWMPSVLR